MGLTIRQTMAHLMGREFITALDLARALLLTPREVEQHLVHLKRSHKGRLQMCPAKCLECGYLFKNRQRLDAPGRCPRCRSQRLEGPWFHISG